MFRSSLIVLALTAVASAQIDVHKVDTLLQSDGLFPGHTVSHKNGDAKGTVKSFALTLEDPSVLNAAYDKYKSNFAKSTPPSEYKIRKDEFKKAVQRVMEHNLHRSEGTETYGKAINKFSDMTFPEFTQKYGGVKFPNSTTSRRRSVPASPVRKSRQNYPPSFDWRDQNMVSPIRDQGQCGSCILFATCALVESNFAIDNGAGNFPCLSPQQLIDCLPNAGGCSGNTFSNIIPYVQQAGLTSEQDDPYRPYLARSGTCPSPVQDVVTIQGYTNIPQGADSIAQTIASTSPVAVSFRENNDFKDFDGKSIFNSRDFWCPLAPDGHAVLAIGYGTDPDSGLDY